jgi:hypothetical protein
MCRIQRLLPALLLLLLLLLLVVDVQQTSHGWDAETERGEGGQEDNHTTLKLINVISQVSKAK